MTPLLSARRLHKSFGGVRAVHDVSFDIPTGAIFAIIGPNGAGKSTMLNLISGIYQPDSGSLRFGATASADCRRIARVRLGIARTFQKIRLFKQLSVLDNVLAGFHVHHAIPAWQYRHSRSGASGAITHVAATRRMELLEFVGLGARHASSRARSPTASSACSNSRARSRPGRSS